MQNFIAFDEPIAAPLVALATEDGPEQTFEDYLGKVVVVNFWATWCGPCMSLVLANSFGVQSFGFGQGAFRDDTAEKLPEPRLVHG